MTIQPDNIIQFYLKDLSLLLKEKALDAKRMAKDPSDNGFAMGRAMAFYEMLSLMQQQADVFGLDYASIGIDDIRPDHEWL